MSKFLKQLSLRATRPGPGPDFFQAALVYVNQDDAALVLRLGQQAPSPVVTKFLRRTQPRGLQEGKGKPTEQCNKQAKGCNTPALHELHAKQSTSPERGAHEHPIGHRFLKQVASLFAIAVEAAKQVGVASFYTQRAIGVDTA